MPTGCCRKASVLAARWPTTRPSMAGHSTGAWKSRPPNRPFLRWKGRTVAGIHRPAKSCSERHREAIEAQEVSGEHANLFPSCSNLNTDKLGVEVAAPDHG